MGFSKIVNKGNGKIIAVHQLSGDGKAYAEDVTIEVQAGVAPSRLDYLALQDGKVGVFSFSFTASDQDVSSLKFPEA